MNPRKVWISLTLQGLGQSWITWTLNGAIMRPLGDMSQPSSDCYLTNVLTTSTLAHIPISQLNTIWPRDIWRCIMLDTAFLGIIKQGHMGILEGIQCGLNSCICFSLTIACICSLILQWCVLSSTHDSLYSHHLLIILSHISYAGQRQYHCQWDMSDLSPITENITNHWG